MCFNKVSINCPNICIVSKKELAGTFSFLGKNSVASVKIKKGLQNATGRTLPYCKLRVIFKTPSKFVNHFHLKDVLPKKLCSGVVYRFKCNNCNAIYCGETMFTSKHLNI